MHSFFLPFRLRVLFAARLLPSFSPNLAVSIRKSVEFTLQLFYCYFNSVQRLQIISLLRQITAKVQVRSVWHMFRPAITLLSPHYFSFLDI